MAITKLNSNQLYRKCDTAKFDFTTTADLEERLSALGQDRAISAVELGINIKSRGYNLFCLGPEGTGKTSLVKRILEKEAQNRPTPNDWAYVYNFEESYKPIAISFPAGQASNFAKDVDELINRLSTVLPAEPANHTRHCLTVNTPVVYYYIKRVVCWEIVWRIVFCDIFHYSTSSSSSRPAPIAACSSGSTPAFLALVYSVPSAAACV